MYQKQIDIIRTNIRQLMARDSVPSENALAKKAGVDQKTINNLLAVDTLPNPTLKVLDSIAEAFEVATWMLWVDGFDFTVVGKTPLMRMTAQGYQLFNAFENISDEKRKSILDFVLFHIAESDPIQAEKIRNARKDR